MSESELKAEKISILEKADSAEAPRALLLSNLLREVMAPGRRQLMEDDGGWILSRSISHKAEALLMPVRQPIE